MGYPQSGIMNRPPGHQLVVALTFRQREPEAACAAVEALREVVRQELTSDLDETNPGSPKDQPSAETGELGFDDGYDRAHLTITMGISAAGFDALGTAADQRPQDLIPIPW